MAWGLAQISALELREWQALYDVEADERQEDRDIAEHGAVVHHGRPHDDDDDDDVSEDDPLMGPADGERDTDSWPPAE